MTPVILNRYTNYENNLQVLKKDVYLHQKSVAFLDINGKILLILKSLKWQDSEKTAVVEDVTAKKALEVLEAKTDV